ncbi:dienelactone hydrolase family protein [Fluviispira multicolorata]|uniref:Prolyl oligopeptidase family serine peptidase n=1 Tax=Fluviispira multicolorata TaxID=2654512 RepID=A0A833N235_9BACT|nr:dienelactone hydrolase family protein [Fluviispira multicolorata]KAB8027382.1 prolyl oligopeptidase family serine peptidase [Fluviispira multicolorata]
MKSYNIDYRVDETVCRGYVVEPKSEGRKLPGILMFTDFWGVNARQKRVAEKWANLGAVVFVADLYGEQKIGSSFEDSGKLMHSAIENEEVFQKKIFIAYDMLKKNPLVNNDNLFSIGYCFGGAVSLKLARMSEGLKGVISIHGLLTSQLRVPSSKKMPKILILNGARDGMVPDSDIKNFHEEMIACNADFTFISYGQSTHAFTNADAAGNAATAYNYIADKRTDFYVTEFLRESF